MRHCTTGIGCKSLLTEISYRPVVPVTRVFQGFIREWTDAALETGADAVFWDEPHFYSNETERIGCYCKYCQDLAERGKPAIGSFLREVCGKVKSRGSQNVVCLLPSSLERKDTLDWNEIAGLESVMNIGSTPYLGNARCRSREIRRPHRAETDGSCIACTHSNPSVDTRVQDSCRERGRDHQKHNCRGTAWNRCYRDVGIRCRRVDVFRVMRTSTDGLGRLPGSYRAIARSARMILLTSSARKGIWCKIPAQGDNPKCHVTAFCQESFSAHWFLCAQFRWPG